MLKFHFDKSDVESQQEGQSYCLGAVVFTWKIELAGILLKQEVSTNKCSRGKLQKL